MNETALVLIATGCAGAMVMLVRAGASADLRAAVRTTMILLVGWSVALATYPTRSLHSLSMQTWIFLILSCLAIAVLWTTYIRRARQPAAGSTLSIDQLNVGFAILFAVTLFGTRPTSQSGLGALAIVAGAVILASKQK
jgi:transporter family protein